MLCGIFRGIEFDHIPTLGEVIKELGWGSNRDIRQSGFRIDKDFNYQVSPFFSNRIKSLPRLDNPKTLIQNGSAIMVPKGTQVAVIIIKGKQND